MGVPITFATWISLFTLLLSGDVELNPGPTVLVHVGPYADLEIDAYADTGDLNFNISIPATVKPFIRRHALYWTLPHRVH